MQWPVSEAGSEQLYAEKFATANGKPGFIHADWMPICETTTPEFPFLLSMGRCIFHWDTGKMTRSSSHTANWVEIHPKDAAELGITEGDTVEIMTKDTVICGTAWITDEILEKNRFYAVTLRGCRQQRSDPEYVAGCGGTYAAGADPENYLKQLSMQ